MRKTLILTVVACIMMSLTTAGHSAKKQRETRSKYPKNVILFVADGLDYSQLALAQSVYGKQFFMTSLPSIGTQLPAYESISPEWAFTLVDSFKKKRKSIGLVSNGHVESILKQSVALLPAQADVIFAGGRKSISNWDTLKKEYHIVTSASELPTIRKLSRPVLGLFHAQHFHYQIDRKKEPAMKDEPPLQYMTQKAIELLSQSQQGFFLIVTPSLIQQAIKEGDHPALTQEVVELDKAVKAAHAFAKKKRNTLVIVSSHFKTNDLPETYKANINKLKEIKSSHQEILNIGQLAPVPIFSFGPQSALFKGLIETPTFLLRLTKAARVQTITQ